MSCLETSPSNQLVVLESNLCQICGFIAHGNHFGAFTCRACAAFFRRFGNKSAEKILCINGFNECDITNHKSKICKKCRLQKCFKVGMTSEKFQLDRDLISSIHGFKSQRIKKHQQFKYPQSLEQFVGRPHFLISCEPAKDIPKTRVINVQYLIDKAIKVFEDGPAFPPPNHMNSLEKLAYGLKISKQGLKSDFKFVSVIGERETFTLWEHEFLSAARWLTYFDELRILPISLKIEMLKLTWILWSRLDKIVQTADARKKKWLDDDLVIITNEHFLNLHTIDLDLKWFTNCTREQLERFLGFCTVEHLDNLISPVLTLNPDDVEISFMLAQLCFHFSGKRLKNDVVNITDKYEDIISNDLHDYYMKNNKMPNYALRVARMIKINNIIMAESMKIKERTELSRLLRLVFVAFSEPDMFIHNGI